MQVKVSTTEELRKFAYAYEVHICPKVVLVIITEKDTWKKTKVHYRLMRRATYEKYKHRKSLRWTLNEGELIVVSKTYLRYYKEGKGTGYCAREAGEPRIASFEDWADIIESGQLDRVVTDSSGMDGFFYNIDGRPVLRTFHFDYIHSRISSQKYNLFGYAKYTGKAVIPLLEHMRKIPGVSNVLRVPIPWYNNEIPDEVAAEFDFTPSPQFFGEMVKKNCLEREDMMRDRVTSKLTRFRKKSPEFRKNVSEYC